MLHLNESNWCPYVVVLVVGNWRRLFILKLYGSTFLLQKSHRKEGFPEVIHLYTSSISFKRCFQVGAPEN